MKIEDCFVLPEKGVVLSGANVQLDDLSTEIIKEMIGEVIIVENNRGKLTTFKVESVDISSSLIGKKNICICLGQKVKIMDIEIGYCIWSIIEKLC